MDKYEIEIPDEFKGLIESCVRTKYGQQRRYGPSEYQFELRITKKELSEEEKKRVLDFCQKHCHACRYSAEDYKRLMASGLPFNEEMSIVAAGRYMLNFFNTWEAAPGSVPIRATYLVTEDYID